MAQNVNRPSGDDSLSYKPQGEKLKKALVVEDVRVIERKKIVDVPELHYKPKEVEYEKPVIIEKETVKYNVKEKETIRYNTKEEETIKYVLRKEEVEKPVVVLKTYEKPVVEEKRYEKPIIEEKTYEVVTPENIQAVRDLSKAVDDLNEKIPKLKENLDSIRDYKLIEEEITVPKIRWQTVRAERIEWVDVKKERPKDIKGGK